MTGLVGAAADLISTALTIIADVCMGIGALCLLCWVLVLLGMWLARRAERKAPMIAIPAGDWTDQLIADIGMCPWCQLRECGNPRMCTCEELCGMPLCRPMETETAP